MAEIRGSFGSVDEWKAWRLELGEVGEVRRSIVDDVRSRGYVEPLTDLIRRPYEIAIRDKDLHESISSHGLNSRKRAFLLQIVLELQVRNWLSRRDVRILGAEALSPVATSLRGNFPFYWGTEFLPDEATRLKFSPIPHMDLQRIGQPDESFDAFVGSGVFEHMPDLDRALREIHRVLKPGGVAVAYFPFDPGRLSTVVKASLAESGEIVHHGDAEYLANPLGGPQGRLVFQWPGWDLLPKLRSFGFEDAYFSMVASSHFGIVSNANVGIFVLTASKSGDKSKGYSRPSGVVAKTALPEKLCVLIALPRSGTTMLTSVFAVHSRCEAVYEPWNGKKVSGDAESTIEAIAKVEALPNLSGKMLFVKETAAFQEPIRGLRHLYDCAPFPVEKHMLMLLRKPEHTFLSEIERRKEWWKEDVSVNAATFDQWVAKSRLAVRQMLEFGHASDGIVVLLEDFAAQPAQLLGQLADRIGFTVEREQLEYEKHVDKSRIRGDLNVTENPTTISMGVAISRGDKTETLEKLISGSVHADWFSAFRGLYGAIHANGGIMSIRDIPRQVIEALRPAKQPSPQ